MKNIRKILCPVDLSKNSLEAIDLATQLAKQNDAKVCFIYVAPQWLPDEAMIGNEYIRESVEADKKEFELLNPSDVEVDYEHIFVHGNAGPEIVRATKSMDMAVLCTHGRSGLMRLIMGSVAQYVLRNAKCPVVMVKGLASADDEQKSKKRNDEQKHFVTEIMRQVKPIHTFDRMDDVLANLRTENETAAPVVDGSEKCIGILTATDIEQYHVLLERFAARDETVIKDMFEVDKYGLRRQSNHNFDRVERHMTKDVISIRNDESIEDAIKLFEAHQDIHHLVVLDEDRHAIGIVVSADATLPEDSEPKSESSSTATPKSSLS